MSPPALALQQLYSAKQANMGLYRRLSSRFSSKKSSSQDSNQASVNGTSSLGAVKEHVAPQSNGTHVSGAGAPATDGTSISQSLDQTKTVTRDHPSFASKPEPAPLQPRESKDTPAATRKDVESAFEEFAQLIHASRRPMPTQMGDGSYLEKDEPSGWFQDLRHLSLKDVDTAKEIMEDKRSGKPQDDRQMHMEHIMQVKFSRPAMITSNTSSSSLLNFQPNQPIEKSSLASSSMSFGSHSSIHHSRTWGRNSAIVQGMVPTTAISSRS